MIYISNSDGIQTYYTNRIHKYTDISNVDILRKVLTGKPNYTKKVLEKMTNQGWEIMKSYSHPDGTLTYVLEL